jgi:hypothetical protein
VGPFIEKIPTGAAARCAARWALLAAALLAAGALRHVLLIRK